MNVRLALERGVLEVAELVVEMPPRRAYWVRDDLQRIVRAGGRLYLDGGPVPGFYLEQLPAENVAAVGFTTSLDSPRRAGEVDRMRHAASGPAAGRAAARRRRAPPRAADRALLLAGVSLLLLAAACTRGDEGARGDDLAGDGSGDAAGPEVPAERTEPMPAATLVGELGCGACHRGVPPADTARRRAPSLGPGGRPLPRSFVFEYLRSPRPQRPDIGRTRMPDFHLSEAEAAALTLYLDTTLPSSSGGEEGETPARLREQHPDVDAETGRRIFEALNCAGCHGGTDIEPWPAGPDLSRQGARSREGWLGAWLAHPTAVRPFGFHPGTGSRMPDFRLSATEADSLGAYLSRRGAGPAPGERETAGGPADTGAPGAGPSRDAGAFTRYEASKTEKLLRRRLACLGCHRLGREGGRTAPDLATVGGRRPDAYVRGMVEDPEGTVPGTVMPPTPVSAETRELIVRYLTYGEAGAAVAGERTEADGAPRSGYLSLVDHPVRAPDPWMRRGGQDGGGTARPGDAAALYRHRCAACHGTDGGGDGPNARYLPTPPVALADSAYMSGVTDARLFDGIHAGGRVLGRSHRMPAFGQALSRDEVWSLVGHLRELCRCRGPAWYRDNDESDAPPVDAGAAEGGASGGEGRR